MSLERRTAFRFQIRDELRDAVLEVRRRRLPVELLDQSANGFSIKAPLDVDVEINELVAIETWGGRCDAIVARVTDHREFRRLGLHRVSDLAPTKPTGWMPKWLADRMPAQADRAKRNSAAWIMAAIAFLTLATFGWLANRTPQASQTKDPLAAAFPYAPLATDPSIGAKSPAPPADAAASNALEAPLASAADVATNAEEKVEAGVGDAGAEGSSDVRVTSQITKVSAPSAVSRSPGSSAAEAKPPMRSTQTTLERLASLRTLKAANELGLSEQQKLEISRLMKRVSSEISRARTRLSGKSQAVREARVDSIAVDAESRAMAILNPEQQIRWKAN